MGKAIVENAKKLLGCSFDHKSNVKFCYEVTADHHIVLIFKQNIETIFGWIFVKKNPVSKWQKIAMLF